MKTTEKTREYEQRVAAALFQAVIEASRDPESNTAFLLTGEIMNACLQTVALLAATSEVTASPTKTREFADNCAKRLRSMIASTKEIQASGGLDFMTIVTTGPRH